MSLADDMKAAREIVLESESVAAALSKRAIQEVIGDNVAEQILEVIHKQAVLEYAQFGAIETLAVTKSWVLDESFTSLDDFLVRNHIFIGLDSAFKTFINDLDAHDCTVREISGSGDPAVYVSAHKFRRAHGELPELPYSFTANIRARFSPAITLS